MVASQSDTRATTDELAFLHQEQKASGEDSTFSELVRRDSVDAD